MKTSLLNIVFGYSRNFVLALAFVFLLAVAKGYAQDLPEPVPHLESLPVGTIVIPMDAKQVAPTGPGGASRFNLKAYGLVQRLLQNNIPMKWAIKAGKSKDDVDFTVAAARLYPSSTASSSQAFSGGPFIVPQGYENIALQVIDGFRNETPPNNSSDSNAQNVAVYRTTAVVSADIRYTITHKPKIAIGQNTGITSGVHQKLYDFALINDYSNVNGSTINKDSCYTIATQPHFDEPAFISNFRDFLESGGNVLLQCLSITTFENQSPSGHFQTTNGYIGVGNSTDINNTPLRYENGDMPFSQFLGEFNGNQLGAVEDYRLNGGNFQNGTFDVVRNDGTATQDGRYRVATESHIAGPSSNGGSVFMLGGHDYFQDGTNTTAENYNAQRMILNSLFVPVTRPAACNVAVPVINSYKSVKLTDDVNHNGLVTPGDTVTWTITYVNTTPIAFPNFQITDGPLDSKIDYVAGSLTVVGTGGATTSITKNASYNGQSDVNMLTAGGTFDVGGKIVLTIQTKAKIGSIGDAFNQTNASGTNVAGVGVTSDALDSQTSSIQTVAAGVVLPPGSIPQGQQTANIDRTRIQILVPTAAQASISGRVVTQEGYGISRAQIKVVNPSNGSSKSVTTNPFGYFTVTGVDVGSLYVVSVSARGYVFPVSSHTFVVNDDISGLVFSAGNPAGKEPGASGPGKTLSPAGKTVDPKTSIKIGR